MKFCSMNLPESEVESLLMSPCWGGPTQSGSQDQYLLEGHKLLLEHDLDSLHSDSDPKNSLDVLDNLLLNSSSLNALSDLKPLPPFTNYTGHLSINGIAGHHYHAIAQRLPDESNNNYMQSAYHQHTNAAANSTTQQGTGNATTNSSIQLSVTTSGGGGNTPLSALSGGGNGNNSNHGSSTDHNIVSSSTCLPESVLSPDVADACLNDVKLFADSQLDSKLYSIADSCVIGTGLDNGLGSLNNNLLGGPDSMHGGVRIYADAKDLSDYVDMNSIDDIAAIIGSVIADTEEGNDTRDSWMELSALINSNCLQQQDTKLIGNQQQQDSLSDFMLPNSPMHTANSTLQSLISQGYMPLLQNRLQNGPPTQTNTTASASSTSSSSVVTLKTETPSSTSYSNELAIASSSSTSSPPGSVVSTTENLMINPRYLTNPQLSSSYHQISISTASMKSSSDGICSPDLLGNFPHTTTVTPTSTPPKAKRSRNQKKSTSQQSSQSNNSSNSSTGTTAAGGPINTQLNTMSPSSVSYNANDLSGLLGKEKQIHRCEICGRGFLNKSNIKVHMRTHTGEKPFRCEVCAKAFRQKAHLLKHQQIHKRIGRD